MVIIKLQRLVTREKQNNIMTIKTGHLFWYLYINVFIKAVFRMQARCFYKAVFRVQMFFSCKLVNIIQCFHKG